MQHRLSKNFSFGFTQKTPNELIITGNIPAGFA